ncbi:hypothetical protein [Pedobacter sp. UBA4863]|uniref:hypothetical protein n=1 Tax=Pedobacter sp. UBA4863 TaxID=1947060 RepID=UPI0025E4638A|nr:hypothetical protein [Pedobacter sp. UBA4863]
MRKLTLNKINFSGATELTREQLKKVMGGYTMIGAGGCSSDSDCATGQSCCPDNQGGGYICQYSGIVELPSGGSAVLPCQN